MELFFFFFFVSVFTVVSATLSYFCPSFSKGSLVRLSWGVARPEVTNGVQAEAFMSQLETWQFFNKRGGEGGGVVQSRENAWICNFTRISMFISTLKVSQVLTSARLCPMVWKIRASWGTWCYVFLCKVKNLLARESWEKRTCCCQPKMYATFFHTNLVFFKRFFLKIHWSWMQLHSAPPKKGNGFKVGKP